MYKIATSGGSGEGFCPLGRIGHLPIPADCTHRCATSGPCTAHLPEGEMYSNQWPPHPAFTCTHLASTRPAFFSTAVYRTLPTDYNLKYTLQMLFLTLRAYVLLSFPILALHFNVVNPK